MPPGEWVYEIQTFNTKLESIIDHCPTSSSEKEYRKKQLSDALVKLLEEKEVSNRYFNLAHEIKCIHFLEIGRAHV